MQIKKNVFCLKAAEEDDRAKSVCLTRSLKHVQFHEVMITLFRNLVHHAVKYLQYIFTVYMGQLTGIALHTGRPLPSRTMNI